jgi:hypothetical protein
LEADYDIGNKDVIISPIEHIEEDYDTDAERVYLKRSLKLQREQEKKQKEERQLQEVLQDKPMATTAINEPCKIYGINCWILVLIGSGALIYLNTK